MNKTRFARMAWAVLACVAASILIVTIGEAQSTAIGTRTIEGLVRDIACPLQKTNSTSTNYGKDCIIQCAKAGSPLGILTDDGTVYVPVTETMPDTGQNQLKSFVGDHVKATGKVFARNGAHAIQISEIHQVADAAGK
ncbi:MAG: hypothetical protein WB795_08425 [Candidatus Acidiferrales bacterium]|jgi:hypothetical protein